MVRHPRGRFISYAMGVVVVTAAIVIAWEYAGTFSSGAVRFALVSAFIGAFLYVVSPSVVGAGSR